LLALRRSALRRSLLEGLLFAGTVGFGEFWFVAQCVRLGARDLDLAAVITLPQLVGAFGAMAMLRILRRVERRRPWVVGAAVGQSCSLAGLAWISATGRASPGAVIACASVYVLFGQASGTGWSSWFADVVPRQLRGRWFGARTRLVAAGTFLATVGSGLWLQGVQSSDAGGVSFAAIYALGAVLRVIGAGVLSRTWEPAFEPPQAMDRIVATMSGPDGRAARAVVIAGAAMMLAVCVSSPFFAPHMLDTLAFSYPTYIAAQGTMILAKILALGPWGRLVDRRGPLLVYRASALGVALIPVLWMFADRAWVVFVAEALGGIAWAGLEVAMLALTFGAVGPRRRAVLLTSQSLANGVAQVTGGLLATGVSTAAGGAHEVSFGVSAGARVLVAVLAPLALGPAAAAGDVAMWRIGSRVVGWMPSGGIVRQLIGGASDRPAPALEEVEDGATPRGLEPAVEAPRCPT
jgi:MFS family permease